MITQISNCTFEMLAGDFQVVLNFSGKLLPVICQYTKTYEAGVF